MSFLRSWTRAKLTATALQWLKDTCTLEQEVILTGEFGEPTRGWSLVASGVACRLITSGGAKSGNKVQETGAQETLEQEYRLVVAVGTPVGINQRVTVGGNTYFIVRIESGLTDELFRQAVVVKR